MKALKPIVNIESVIDQRRQPNCPKELKLIAPRQYRGLYTMIMSTMPQLVPEEDMSFELSLELTKRAMSALVQTVEHTGSYKQIVTEALQEMGLSNIQPNSFLRVTLALSEEGPELALGIWGKGFQVPIHSHEPGYMFETILEGSAKFKFYDVYDHSYRTVKEVEEILADSSTVMENYWHESKLAPGETSFIHSFEILEDTISLHYIPGATGDGKAKLYTLAPDVQSN